MGARGQLRVIGTRGVYRYFLPGTDVHFSHAEFYRVPPRNAELFFARPPKRWGLSIVVNPFDYALGALNALRGPTLFWILNSLCSAPDRVPSEAPHLFAEAKELAEARLSFVEKLARQAGGSFVVSDPASLDQLTARGIEAVLSPPPVADSVGDVTRHSRMRREFFSTEPNSKFSRMIWNEVESFSEPISIAILDEDRDWPSSQFFISVSSSVLAEFSYEAAISLVAGQTLISGKMRPLWGFEPGIDFIEYSTPAELAHVLLHLERWPRSTDLMRYRGNHKSSAIYASQVYQQILTWLKWGSA